MAVQRQTIDDYFVCIGAQKAGTTWLARILAQHPDVFVTPVKEIHYFDHIAGISSHLSDRKRRSRYRKFHQKLWTQWHRFPELRAQWPWYRRYMKSPLDDDWYRSLFGLRDGRRMAGEATPEYALIGPQGFRHLARLAPGARIIYVLRNPVTRAWSQVLHHCRRAGIDATRQPSSRAIELIEAEQFQALGNYCLTIAHVESVFPHSQFRVFFYEDLHEDRLAGIQSVCEFLDVPFDRRHFPGIAQRFNPSQNATLPEAVRAYLREKYRELAATLGEREGRLPEIWRREFGL